MGRDRERGEKRASLGMRLASKLYHWLAEHNWEPFQVTGEVFPRRRAKKENLSLMWLAEFDGRTFTMKLCRQAMRLMFAEYDLQTCRGPGQTHYKYIRDQARKMQQVAQRVKRTARNRKFRERWWSWNSWSSAMDQVDTQPLHPGVSWLIAFGLVLAGYALAFRLPSTWTSIERSTTRGPRHKIKSIC